MWKRVSQSVQINLNPKINFLDLSHVFSYKVTFDAIRITKQFSLGTPAGSRIRTASTHSSPVVDLHLRGVCEASLKPQNGEAYVPFDDQVPCMCRHLRISFWVPQITFTHTQYTHFSVFRCFLFHCANWLWNLCRSRYISRNSSVLGQPLYKSEDLAHLGLPHALLYSRL